MITSLSSNRQRDIQKWKALALEYEMKIRYLERALAQQESKLRLTEQVKRDDSILSPLYTGLRSELSGRARFRL